MASLSNINGIFDVHSTGAIQFNGNHGTAGQILKSNGNAAPTWVAASTVIGGPYLPLTGGTLTGATATAAGISFTVGGTLTGTSATFSGDVSAATFNTLPIETARNNNANRIVRTNVHGYVDFGWINTTSGATTSTIDRIYASNDGYIRYVTPATFRTQVTDPYYAPAGTVSGVTSVATGNGLTGGTITSTGTLSMSGTYSGRFNPTGYQIVDTRAGDITPADEVEYSQVMHFTNQVPGLSGWKSLIQMKGWHDGYSSWQIIGPSDTTANDDWYLRSGKGTTWNTAREIFHTGNFTPGNYLPLTGGTMTGLLQINTTTGGVGTALKLYSASLSQYPQIHSNANLEAMWNYKNTSAEWYVGIRTSSQLVGASGFHFYNTTSSQTVGGWDINGNSYSIASSRAPIFYDSNNTGYYGDFASTSILNFLQIDGKIGFQGSIAENDGRGLYFHDGTGYSTSYAIYREPGAWSPPYPDLRIAFHTGISLGANASYNGIRFFNDQDMVTQVMSVNNISDGLSTNNVYVNNSLVAGSSLRAPIFYDSNNTSYYLDPTSYSSMWGVAVRGDFSSTDTGNQIFLYGSGGTTTSAIGFKNGGQFPNPTGNGDGWNTYLTMDTAGRGWVFRQGTGGTNFTSVNNSGWILNNGIWQANASMRSPIFYDSNNTAYFGDFGGTYSNITKLKISANWGTPSGVSPDDAQIQIRGTYPSMTFRSTNANKMWLRHMDVAGEIQHYAATGTDSTAWSIKHTMKQSGTFESQSSLRAPIFYDLNNTGYYVDPASSSYINTLQTAGLIQAGSSGTSNIYMGGTSGSFFRFHCNAGATYFDMNAGTINWRQGSSTRYYFYPSTANMTINGTLTQYSDIRYKENIVEIPDAINKIKSIRGVYYNRTDFNTEPTKIGVIAQEVEVLMPELILQAEDTDMKSVSYNELTAVLVQAIKEQQVIIDDLKLRIKKLEL